MLRPKAPSPQLSQARIVIAPALRCLPQQVVPIFRLAPVDRKSVHRDSMPRDPDHTHRLCSGIARLLLNRFVVLHQPKDVLFGILELGEPSST